MRSFWNTTHQQHREKNALILVNQGPHHSHHLFPGKIPRNIDSLTLKIPLIVRPHHHKKRQTLHHHRCRSYRDYGRLRPPCTQMQVPHTNKIRKTSTPSSTPQPQPCQTPITRNLDIILWELHRSWQTHTTVRSNASSVYNCNLQNVHPLLHSATSTLPNSNHKKP